RVLAHVARTEGISQVTLAQRLEISAMTLGKHLERMEAAGLIQRQRDAHDRRAWNVFVTERARPKLERIRAIAQDIRADALRDLNADEERTLVTLLQRLRANMLNPFPQDQGAARLQRSVS
ncbi:MAG: MarR family transcriptional regulator, partial [Planctomycetales bacterium]|nr:MarR family transcriptional regulator [Planctomycetales bacterium]